MANISITDFFLKLGYDGREAEKGIDRLESRVNKLNSRFRAMQKNGINLKRQEGRVAKQKVESAKKEVHYGKRTMEMMKYKKQMLQSVLAIQKKINAMQPASIRNYKRITKNVSLIDQRHSNMARQNRVWNRSLGGSNRLLSGALSHLTGMFGAYLAIQKIQQSISASYQAGKGSQRADTSLLAVSRLVSQKTAGREGSPEQIFEKQRNYLEKMSKEIGVSLANTTTAYSRFLASAATPLSDNRMTLNQVEDVFKGVQQMGIIHKLTTEEMKFVNMAVTQMMQKGKIQSEELRRQLAEKMPGAYEMMAEAAGKTTAEFDNIMKSGEALAYKILPKFGENLIRNANIMAKGDIQSYARSSVAGLENIIKASLELKNKMFFLDWTTGLVSLGQQIEKFVDNQFSQFDKFGAYAGNFTALLAQDLKELNEEQRKREEAYLKMTPDERRKKEKEILEDTKRFYNNIKSTLKTIKDIGSKLVDIIQRALPIFQMLVNHLYNMVNFVAKIFGIDGKNLLTDILAWGLALKAISKLPFIGWLIGLAAGGARYVLSFAAGAIGGTLKKLLTMLGGGSVLKYTLSLSLAAGFGALIGKAIYEGLSDLDWGREFLDQLGSGLADFWTNFMLSIPDELASVFGIDKSQYMSDRARIDAFEATKKKTEMKPFGYQAGEDLRNWIKNSALEAITGTTNTFANLGNNLSSFAPVLPNFSPSHPASAATSLVKHQFGALNINVTASGDLSDEAAQHISQTIKNEVENSIQNEYIINRASGEN